MEADDVGVLDAAEDVDLLDDVLHLGAFPAPAPSLADELGSEGLACLPVRAFSHHSEVATAKTNNIGSCGL